MSSPKSLFGKTTSKKAKIDNEETQEHTTSQNTGRNIPSTNVRKPAFNPNLLSSAFYTGPTMYGGAGACSSSSPYNQYTKSKFYDRKKTDIKVTPSASDNTMSQTSRHILELLEQYSSPISDAKRVPINNKPTSVPKRTLNSSIFDLSRKSPNENTLTPTSSKSHRFRELQIPTISTLMKIKKTNRTGGNTHAAILASLSSSLPYKPDSYSLRSGIDSSTYKSKIKSKLSSRSNKVDEEEMAEPVNLPYISLQMTGLPTFTMEPFKLQSKPQSAPMRDTTSLPSTSVTTNFKFTSPVSLVNTDKVRATTKFKFSEPINIFISNSSAASDEPDATKSNCQEAKKAKSDSADMPSKEVKPAKNDFAKPLLNFKSTDAEVTLKSSMKRPSELWNGNDYKHNEKDKSPLLNGDIKSLDTYGKRPHSSYDSSNSTKDKDKSGFGEINASETKKVKSESAVPGPASGGLDSFIKKQQQQWECESCMSRNDQNQLKCLCCESPKPGEKPPPPPKAVSNSGFSGMESFIKKQQQQWECPCCMIRNDQNRTKCLSCEAAKPGSEPAPAAAMKFNFGNTPNTFKFGIDKANDPVTTTPENKLSIDSNKIPVTSLPTTGFVFGNPTTTTETKPGNGSIGGFKFGIPNNSPAKLPETTTTTTLGLGEKKESGILPTSSGGFTFGIPKDVESKVSSEPNPTDIKPTFSFSSPRRTDELKLEPEKPVLNFMAKPEEPKAPITTVPATSVDNNTSLASSTSLVNTSVKSSPVFSFGTTQSTPKPAFGGGTPFQFGTSPSSTPSNVSSESTVKPSPGLFSFGSKNTTSLDTKLSSDIPKPAFQLPNPGSGSLLPSSNITSIGKENLKTSTIGSGIQFPSTPMQEKTKDQVPAGPFFSFGSMPTNVSNAVSGASNPNSNISVFTFGSAAITKPETQSLFNPPAVNSPANNLFGSKPSSESAINSSTSSLFKPTPSTTQSFIAPASSNIFGSPLNTTSPVPSSNVFGSGSLNPTVTKSPVPIFGSSSIPSDPTPQPPQTGSLFSNPSVPSFNSGNIFGNTAQTNPMPAQPANVFGNSMNKPASEGNSGMFMNNPQPPSATPNIFGSAMPATAPTQSSTALYGSSPSVPTPVFGASIPFGEPSQSQAQQVSPFSFGSPNSAQPPVANFGQVYSFGSGAAAPSPVNPQYNFSMGYTSSPGAMNNPMRRIKKAVRRNVLR